MSEEQNTQVEEKIDKELENLFILARRNRDDNNSESALNYYQQITVKDPNNWEAYFYTTYYQATDKCKIAEMGIAANKISNSLKTTFDLIKSYVNEEKQEDAVIEVKKRIVGTAISYIASAENFYNGISSSVSGKFLLDAFTYASSSVGVMINFEKLVKENFPQSESLQKERREVLKTIIIYGKGKIGTLQIVSLSKLKDYETEIKEVEPEYDAKLPSQETKSSSGGCYVATCVYGSYDCPQVWTLRRYRDEELDSTWYGRAFINVYYAVSPTLVKWFGETSWFKKMWRGKLDRMVKNLQDKGFDNTPYNDKY